MSKEERLIRLSSPSVKALKERMTATGFRCGYCEGLGWQWKLTDTCEPERTACPLCGGSGKLDAEVTIEWKPTSITNNKND